MSSLRIPALVALAATAVLAVLAGISLVWRDGRPAVTPAEPAAPSVASVPPPAPRPLPAELEAARRDIVALQTGRDFRGAVARWPRLLAELQERWGKDSPDLAAYVYDYALAMKLAGHREPALRMAEEWSQRVPGSLRLELIAATLRAERAIANEAFDTDAVARLEALLREERFPELRGLHAKPEDLYAQLGLVLGKGARSEQSLAAAERGLALAPDSTRCLEIKGAALLALSRSAEAVPVFEALVAVADSSPRRYHLGLALLQSGEAARALEVFEPLLAASLPELEPGRGWETLGSRLRVDAAAALNRLGRHARALEVLLEPAIPAPETPAVLDQVGVAARGLGATDAASALVRRSRDLAAAENHRMGSRSAAVAGDRASAAYYRARERLVVDQTGPALAELAAGAELRPDLTDLRLEEAYVYRTVGRLDLAEKTLRELVERRASALASAELARVAAARGRVGFASELLASAELGTARLDALSPSGADASDEGLGEERQRAVRAVARRAWALVESGRRDEAGPLLDHAAVAAANLDEVALARIEIALFEGDLAAAASLLTASYDFLPGGPSWAEALRLLLRVSRGEAADATELAELDTSPLVDHPRLLEACLERAAPAGGSWTEWLSRTRELVDERARLLAAIEGLPDGDVRSTWTRVATLALERRARRKAREIGWYLHGLSSRDATAERVLVRALTAPDEVLPRLAAALRGLRWAPGDAELTEARDEAKRFLRWTP